ncbi:MAG: hypothetical protein WC915_04820 [archaeon]|jgi:hypothetical protein
MSTRLESDSKIYQTASRFKTSILSRKILAIKFKRIMLALQTAKRIGNRKKIKLLENESNYIQDDFETQDKNTIALHSELEYLTGHKKFPPQTKPTINQLKKEISTLTKKHKALMEEIVELTGSEYYSPRIMQHKQIEMVEVNIQLTEQEILLEESTTKKPYKISTLKKTIQEDQQHLAKLRQDLKQFE